MPTYTINGQRVKTDAPLSEDDIDEIAQSIGAPAAPSEVPTTRAQPITAAKGFSPFEGDPLRGAALGYRDIVAGAATLPGLVYDVAAIPFNLAGAGIPSASSQVQRGLTAVGLPEPRTPQERLVGSAVRGASILPISPLGALSGAAGEVTGEVLRQGGAPEPVQTLGALGVGLATGSPSAVASAASKVSPIAYVARKLAPGVKRAVEPFTVAGRETIRAREYAQALGNDPAKIQQAIDLIGQGKNVDEVALQLQAPELAAAFKQVTTRSPAAVNELLLRNTALRQEQSNQLAAAQQTLQQLQAQQSANAAQQIAQIQTDLQTAIGAAEKAKTQVGATVPRTSQMAVGQEITASREALYETAKKETRELYESAIKAAGDSTFGIPSLTKTAKTQAASTEVALDPKVAPNTFEILKLFKSSEKTAPGSPFAGVGGADIGGAATIVPPQVSMREADEIMQAINEDLSKISGKTESSANATRRNLMQLKTALKADLKVGAPANAYSAYLQAQKTFLNRVERPFRRGWIANLERQSATREQLLPPSKIANEILKSEENALKFASTFGDDEKALTAARKGIVDLYRRSVVKTGKIDPAAHARFMDKYDYQISVLDDAGLNLRSQFDAAARETKTISAGVEKLSEAAQARTATVTEQQKAALGEISRVQSALTRAAGRVGATDNALAQTAALDTELKTLPDVRAAVEKVKAQIEAAESFDDLARAGSKSARDLTSLASQAVPTGPKWFSTVATALYDALRGARSRLDDRLVEMIANDMINSPEVARLLEKSRAKEITKAKPSSAKEAKNNLANIAAGGAAYSQDNQNALAP